MGLLGSIGNLIGSAAPAIGSWFGGPIGGILGGVAGNLIGGSGGGGSSGGYTGGTGSNAMTALNQMASGGSRYSNTSTGLTGSSQFGNTGSSQFGNTGSNQFGNSGSTQFGTGVWGAQAPYLQDLFARSQGMLSGAGQANYGQAQNALNASQQGLMQMAGGGGEDPRLGIYARQVGQNFNENVLPGMRGDAQMAGGLGSSRAGIGQGLAAARAGQQIQDFAGSLYGENQARQLAALQGLGTVSGQQQQLQSAMQNAPWAALNQYKGLLGGPIQNNLGGSSFGTSGGTSFGNTGGSSFGNSGGSSFGNTQSSGSGSTDYGMFGQQGNGLGAIMGSGAASGLSGFGGVMDHIGGWLGGSNATTPIPNQGGSFGGFNPWGSAAPNDPTFGQFNPWSDYGGA